jgi:hypothetical protein
LQKHNIRFQSHCNREEITKICVHINEYIEEDKEYGFVFPYNIALIDMFRNANGYFRRAKSGEHGGTWLIHEAELKGLINQLKKSNYTVVDSLNLLPSPKV